MTTLFDAIRALPEGARPEDYEITWCNGCRTAPLLVTTFALDTEVEIRRKQKMLSINGIEYPEPERVMPPAGTVYYYPVPSWADLFGGSIIPNRVTGLDKAILERGLMHLSKEAAIAHCKAMLQIKEGE